MKTRRILTALLALVMLISAVPCYALAANETTPTEAEGKLFLDKTATLTDDGSYTINMEAFATGKTTTQTIEKGVPLDIVLVLDQSGSMSQELGNATKQAALKTAAKNFVEKVYLDGQKHNVEHRIGIATFAGGNGEEENKEDNTKYKYMHTGIYDENGTFVGYEKTSTSKPTYQKFDGTMETNGTYYVKVGMKYVQLTYNKGAANYVPVDNPATDRTDLYGKVNGKYEKATYGEYTANVEAKTPAKGDGKTYYDEKGNQLAWVAEKTSSTTYPPVTVDIAQGNEYWIDFNEGTGKTPDWHKINYRKNGWRDDAGSILTYSVSPDKKHFEYSGISGYYLYTAYTKQVTETSTGKWFLSANGKTPVTPVYEKVTKTGWNVKGVSVTELYELQKGAYKWQYKDGNKTVDYDGRQVYIQTSGSVFGPALVPVADGVNGAGNKQPNFDKAINSMKEEGPTRTALGVELGNKIFEANPIPAGSDRQRIMIVFTDGEPGWSKYDSGEANKAVIETKKTKDTYGAKVYTIGLYDANDVDSKQKTFMENMSSNTKTDQKYYHNVSDASKLDQIFQSIQEDISGSTTSVDLTVDSILRDIMSKEGFELTDKSVVTVSVVPGDATNAADPSKIEWGTPVEVLTLKHDPNAANGVTTANKTNVTVAGSDGKNAMAIVASTHTKNPEGKADLHTVDVTGFDYKDQYIAQAHKGSKLVVEITGVKALPTVTTDQNIFTNHEQSGIWAPATSGNGRELKAPFPKRPETYMPSKSYVVDYAKPLDLAIADFKLNTAQNIDKNGYNPFAPANAKIEHTYGNVDLANNALTYTPKTMNWDGYDTFYVFGTTNDSTVTAASANNNGNVWAKVNVIPANNVYYEDTFVTNESNGTVGITYTGTWDPVETGSNPGAAEDSTNPDDNHGWIPVLDNKGGDTDGSSHHTVASKENLAKATFTFTGTGVDVYSRTSPTTGTIYAELSHFVDGNEKFLVGKIIDTLSASGEYYQIPTLSFHEQPGKDAEGKKIMVPLDYGTYKVTLYVTTDAKTRFDYYLDGIRVYNPLVNPDNTVEDAYGPDELNATFMEVRDMLLDAAKPNQTQLNGPVFIDQLEDKTTGQITTEIATYQDYGPKNEVYLKKDATHSEMLSFKVTPGNKYFIGMKSVTGNPVTVQIGTDADKKEITVNHTADMYYEVTPDANGFIHIQNNSENVLAITKLKVTNSGAAVNTAQVFAATTEPEILASAQAFSMAPVTPEPSEPTEPDVDIENPEEKPQKPTIRDILEKIFGSIGGWFQP